MTQQEAKHTPEPWPGIEVYTTRSARLNDADYVRARICMNACAGMTDEQVSHGLVSASVHSTLAQQRDELLAAAEEFAEWYDERSGDGECRPFENFKAAIARVKGGA